MSQSELVKLAQTLADMSITEIMDLAEVAKTLPAFQATDFKAGVGILHAAVR